MAEERENQDMTGALFNNHEKKSPAQPDFRGNVIIEGKKYWLAGWKKTARESGKQFTSLKVESADGQRRSSERAPEQEPDEDDFFKQ